MVNENFDKFREVQEKHKAKYLGGANVGKRVNDEEYNNRDNTDKSVGATGRKI